MRQILVSAVIAGALAGILVSGLQEIRVVPLILEAETYESAGEAANDATSAAPAPHHHDMLPPTPPDPNAAVAHALPRYHAMAMRASPRQ